MAKVRITLGEPVVIAQSDIVAKGNHWGPYQFPSILQREDGAWICQYHVVEDAASGYGKPAGYAKSVDQGKNWTAADPSEATGLLLPNGDCIRNGGQKAEQAAKVALPPKPAAYSDNYGVEMQIYHAGDVPDQYRGWYNQRKRPGTDLWEMERYDMDVPCLARYTISGLLPYLRVTHSRLDTKGRLWHISYPVFYDGTPAITRPLFAVSEDHGHSFRYVSDINYQPDPQGDPLWDKRYGYTEPDLTFLPDGTAMTLMRTTDGHGVGPMYVAYSHDDCATWSKPVIFDDLGVYPILHTLKNGVTLATYGRPGLYLRATADPSGLAWDDRVELIAPAPVFQEDTCAYTGMITVSDDTVYLVYSDFRQPNAEGKPVKTIMGRWIRAERA